MARKRKPMKKTSDFSADRPIASAKADRLGRKAFSENLAARIQGWKGKDSLVIALCGEWGCGKTSVKNMVIEKLKRGASSKVDLLEFNPWEISGHDSIAAVFFRELALALGRDKSADSSAQAAATRLRKYSKAASFGATALKVVGKAMGVAGVPGGLLVEKAGELASDSAKVAGSGAEAPEHVEKEQSLGDLKRLLSSDMASLERPMLIVIDDIDRLTTDEIREVFQLVKANADFPNLIYLLMFDREIVAGALNSISGGRGNEFLDKIVQALFHVPQPTSKSVHQILFRELDEYLAEAGVGERWDTPRWSRVWPDGLSAYFTNLRCVYRFLGSFGFQVSQMTNGRTFELNPLDLIILETLRLFEPALYEALPSRRSALTEHRHFSSALNEAETNKQAESEITALVSFVHESRHERLRGILSTLFPVIFGHQYPDQNEMLRQLRVGHKDLFDRYFTLSLPAGDVAQADLDELRANFADPSGFVSTCESLKRRELLEAAFERLDAYKQELPKSVFPRIVTSLTNAGDLLPEKDDRDVLNFDALTHAYRLIYFGLKAFDSEEERFGHLRDGVLASSGVRLAVELLACEERRPNSSSNDFLITEEHWTEFKPIVVQRIRDVAANGKLRTMNGLSFLLWRWKEWVGEAEVKLWITSQLQTGGDALWVLKTFLSTMKKESNKVTFTRYIRLDTLAMFCDAEALSRLTETYDLEKLPKDEMRALRAFRQALLWKAEGKPDDYTGDRWQGKSPLEEES